MATGKKWNNMLQIAIYGKGGIGKSTTSANISYTMSQRGIKVLQIGCDPKHDSTRSLLNGDTQSTVLEAIDVRCKTARNLNDLVILSPSGVSCIECGGPEPGIGCAGRGIITAMNELEKCGLKKEEYDVVLYDVLGDVVCGGFAVPLRKEYADVVYLVTSGEFMAIYAANNIIRGIVNHSGTSPRIGGIILNCRGMEDEEDLVKRFSEAVNVPVICKIPRDPLFASAEKEGHTISELFPDSEPASEYRKILDNIIGQADGTARRYPADPLSDEELDRLLKGKELDRNKTRICPKIRIKPSDGEACAARAAAMSLSEVKGLTVVIHGPRACGYNMANIRDVHFLGDVKDNPDLDRTFLDNILCTDMDDNDSIFGGVEKLDMMLQKLLSEGKREIAVLTACIPGIIGDDVGGCIGKYMAMYPDATILDARADGNLTGSALDGIRLTRKLFASLIDKTVEPQEHIANIISGTGLNQGKDRRRLTDLFDCIGYEINAVLFNGCTVEEIRNCRRAAISFPVSKRDLSPINKSVFESCGLRVADCILPCGVEDTVNWLEGFKNEGNKDRIDKFIESKIDAYRQAVDETRAILSGKRIFLSSWFDRQMDWVADALIDVGAEIIGAVCMSPIPTRPFSRERHSNIHVCEKADSASVIAELNKLKPDLILGNLRGAGMCIGYKNGPLPPNTISIDAATDLLMQAATIIRAPVCSSWMSERGSQ